MEKYFEVLEGKISYKYNLKNTNWFNIGGIVEVFFKSLLTPTIAIDLEFSKILLMSLI